jgi:hypothetical protein
MEDDTEGYVYSHYRSYQVISSLSINNICRKNEIARMKMRQNYFV